MADSNITETYFDWKKVTEQIPDKWISFFCNLLIDFYKPIKLKLGTFVARVCLLSGLTFIIFCILVTLGIIQLEPLGNWLSEYFTGVYTIKVYANPYSAYELKHPLETPESPCLTRSTIQRSNLWVTKDELVNLLPEPEGLWSQGVSYTTKLGGDRSFPFVGPLGYIGRTHDPANPKGYLSFANKAGLLAAVSQDLHPDPEQLSWFFIGDGNPYKMLQNGYLFFSMNDTIRAHSGNFCDNFGAIKVKIQANRFKIQHHESYIQ